MGRSERNCVVRNAHAVVGKGSPSSVTNGSASFWKKPIIRKSLKQETEGCVPASPRAKPARARQARVGPDLRIGGLLGSSTMLLSRADGRDNPPGHSRESGNLCCSRRPQNRGPRFRGDDTLWAVEGIRIKRAAPHATAPTTVRYTHQRLPT